MTDMQFIPVVDFQYGTFKGVPLLFHEGYSYFRTNSSDWVFKQYGLYKYHLRHGDDGDWVTPGTIERDPVWVNYAGFILTKEDLFMKFPESVVQINFEDYSKAYLVIENEEDADDIVRGEYMEFSEFIKKK